MIGDRDSAREAQRLIAERDRRYKLFPSEIFDEFPWNMLLHLFVAMANNAVLSEERLCELSHAGQLVGRRWIAHLVKDGQIEGRHDGEDVVLTATAIDRLRDYLRRPAGREDLVVEQSA